MTLTAQQAETAAQVATLGKAVTNLQLATVNYRNSLTDIANIDAERSQIAAVLKAMVIKFPPSRGDAGYAGSKIGVHGTPLNTWVTYVKKSAGFTVKPIGTTAAGGPCDIVPPLFKRPTHDTGMRAAEDRKKYYAKVQAQANQCSTAFNAKMSHVQVLVNNIILMLLSLQQNLNRLRVPSPPTLVNFIQQFQVWNIPTPITALFMLKLWSSFANDLRGDLSTLSATLNQMITAAGLQEKGTQSKITSLLSQQSAKTSKTSKPSSTIPNNTQPPLPNGSSKSAAAQITTPAAIALSTAPQTEQPASSGEVLTAAIQHSSAIAQPTPSPLPSATVATTPATTKTQSAAAQSEKKGSWLGVAIPVLAIMIH